MSTQNFKIKNGLSIGENEIIDSQGNLTLPEGASIQVGGAPLDALPDQANNSGKYLTTDGSGASWETITQYTPPTNQGAGNFLSGDGTYKTVTVPTAVSQLTNDSGYQTSLQVANTVASLVDSAPTTLDTLNELAAALGDDPNFATTVATNIGNVSSNVNTHIANTSNPHSVTAAQVGLGNVENKSSATIRSEITSSNVTTALGFTPLSTTGTAYDSDRLGGQKDDYYQPASTAITTSNIGSQSVNYATSAGSASSSTNADTLDGNHASAFYLATNPSGYTTNTGTVTSVGGTGSYGGLTLSGFEKVYDLKFIKLSFSSGWENQEIVYGAMQGLVLWLVVCTYIIK